MKVMVLRAPRDLRLADVARPVPGQDQVLVRVTHSGVCGTDLKIYDGGIPVNYPLIMGHEMIGEVIEGGDDRVRRGDRVLIDPVLFCGECFACLDGRTNLCPHGGLLGRDVNGGFSEYVVAPRSHVFRLHDAIESRQAPLIQVLTTCLHAQRLVKILPGQSVVVLGLGVSGQLHVQLAKACGAYPIIGITRSTWKQRLAKELGADITLAAGAEGVRGVLDATDGLGANLIIESTGKVSSIGDGISMARLGGTLLLFGITTATEGALPFYQLYFKELAIVNSRASKSEDYPASIDLVAKGAVKLEPLVTHVMRLSDLGMAIGMLESGADQRMKITLEHA
jgi:L-iditol 2-dehydrogenase